MTREEATARIDRTSRHDFEVIDWCELKAGAYVLTYRVIYDETSFGGAGYELRLAVFGPKGEPRSDCILETKWDR